MVHIHTCFCNSVWSNAAPLGEHHVSTATAREKTCSGLRLLDSQEIKVKNGLYSNTRVTCCTVHFLT